ncbi:DUF3970 family protein [Bacillus cereus group sp. BfR-BA-01380]|uniref:DUF3970 family protein n=1 Tax=Bacillus cereus group sp. BfR-BA-01380 TaxID=2920324 RepID=UPI001F576355|nr:DUF3970 family protein [Bacillus cereus group sp. BfR-BA-01380]
MIRVRIEGTETEVMQFLKDMPEVPGYERTYSREPRKGNNPKYTNSKSVLAYLTYKQKEQIK